MPQGRIEDFDPAIFAHLIEEAGLSRGYVAVYSGVTETVVGRWINGIGSPSAPRAKALADLLGVDVLALSGKTLETADITELRQRCGLEIKDVAEAVDVSKSSLSRLERAINPPSADLMEQLAELYKVPLDTVKNAWMNRRISIYGKQSLHMLPDSTKEYLGITDLGAPADD